MSRSDLCDYSHVYIIVRGTIDLSAAAANQNNKSQENFAIKNNAPLDHAFQKSRYSHVVV